MIPILAGVAIGIIIGAVLVLALAAYVEREELAFLRTGDQDAQGDPVLGRILADVERERDADPRQSARDSATSARVKRFRR